MKKKLFFAMAAATMMFATSCQNDLDVMGNVGDEALVSFTVTTPDMATRAYSDGLTATVLQYAVYDANGEILPQLTKTDATINGSTTVTLQLTTGNQYSVIFWAAAEGAPYTVDFTNKAMTVDYTTALSNDENRDAFYAYDTFTVTGVQTETIELKRPFAQLNIGTKDYAESANAGYTPTHSEVTVKNLANTLNLISGVVSGESNPITFASNAIPSTETFPVDDHKYIAMNYVLVGAEKGVVDIEFTYTDGTNAKTRTVGSVPVQRNFRTNIYGNLLTSEVDINVEIVPEYETPAHEADALQLAAAFGGKVTLTQDITLTAPLNVKANMILNLGNHTISNPNGYAIENSAELTINATDGGLNGLGGIRSNGGKITINGGTFTGSSDWNNGTYQHILKAENTEVVINGGTFDATIGGITNAMINVSNNAVVTINGGTCKNVNGVIPQFAPYMFTYEGNGKLIINDGDFYGGWRFNGTTATTDIYGGNFTVSYDGQSFHAGSTHVLTIYGGRYSQDNGGKLTPTYPQNNLAYGFTSSEDNGWYIVNDARIYVTPATFSSFVFNENDAVYVFTGDFTGEMNIKAIAGKNIIFDGSNATFDNHIRFTAGRIAGNATELLTAKSGNYTFKGFKTNNSIAFGSCAVEALNIEDCEAYMMYFNISNSVVTATGNTIVRPADAQDSYKRYDGGTQKDIIQVYSDNYTLNLYNNTIKDEKGIGNNMEIYGEPGWQQSNVTWTNSITAEGNTISNVSANEALVKIYNDVTYAPIEWPADYRVTDAANALATELKGENTLSGGSCVVSVLCRSANGPDKNILLTGE